MAAIFTTTDRDNVKAALVEAATSGYASVSVAGERVESKSLEELRNLLEYIQADLAGDVTANDTQAGMRIRQLVPGGTG